METVRCPCCGKQLSTEKVRRRPAVHKIMCGDSTSAEDVASLMGGERAAMVFADPPYGIAYHSNSTKGGPHGWDYQPIEGDASVNMGWLSLVDNCIQDTGALYVCTRWDVYAQWSQAIPHNFRVKNCCVWVKNLGGMGDLTGAYAPQHEFIIYAAKGKHMLRGSRDTDVWDIPAIFTLGTRIHPTQKPPKLAAFAIEHSSDGGDLVSDPFLGSGTTAVAAEQLGRLCYGMEIAPAYVAVTLQRLADMQLEPRLLDGAA